MRTMIYRVKMLRACLKIKRGAGLILILAAVLGWRSAQAEQPVLPEYRLKALFLYHFAEFVDWPTNAFADAQSPYVVGVLGNDPFGEDLDKTLEGQSLNGRKFEIRRFKNISQVRDCHILFISSSESRRLEDIFKKLHGQSILTVGEKMDDFAKRGGMIQFIDTGTKLRFAINNQAANDAQLKISSQLLSLATQVY